MGIPAFYRWLVEKYPLCVADVLEEPPTVVNGVELPLDASRPNPNGVEFDNLYLDMNGIIHPCFHPEDQPQPCSYEEVYKVVFKYIDHLFSLVRPRKLLFMAIDGVAPRAKMNQQRARRFRAAKDAADAAAEAEKEAEGKNSDPVEHTSKLDSNVITPGTEFMASLSSALRYYIHLRLNSDPGWRDIKVILSDANVPGEGEHKIASYIRSQRSLPGFDPNTRHCLYGLDADLIMLALATHELHFSILREDVRVGQKNDKAVKFGKHKKTLCGGERRKELTVEGENETPKKKFQFLNIWILREYLVHDLRISSATVKLDLERLIDDFVFMCLFVGNDFLPHVPSLEISEGAIDLLMTVYKREFTRMGGYLTNSVKVYLERVEHFLQVLGSYESAIFRKRSQVRIERDLRSEAILEKKRVKHRKESIHVRDSQRSIELSKIITLNGRAPSVAIDDQVKLGEDGWKERYYDEKFEAKTEAEHEKLKCHAVMKYAEGICWVMHYYYQGVCSWQWFYPYHYAPFASDFWDLKILDINFTLGVPFKPFDQLMGVLPAASAHALPLFYRNLMIDPLSSISDFYPTDFELDMNGKRYSWQAVCKLPFIDESRLLSQIEKVEHTLTDDEKQRNSWALDALFLRVSHPLAPKLLSFHRRKQNHPKLPKIKLKRKLDPKLSGGMNGYAYISEKTIYPSEIYSPVRGMATILKNETLVVYYKNPPVQVHITRLPNGVIYPEKLISKRNVKTTPLLWHEKSAVHRNLHSISPVPKSVSGPHLAKMSRQLVSNYYVGKMQPSCANGIDSHAMDDGLCHKNGTIVEPDNKPFEEESSKLAKQETKPLRRCCGIEQETEIRRICNNEASEQTNRSVLGKRKRRGRERRKMKMEKINENDAIELDGQSANDGSLVRKESAEQETTHERSLNNYIQDQRKRLGICSTLKMRRRSKYKKKRN